MKATLEAPPPPGTEHRRPAAQMWAESPLQMLSAVECHHSGILGARAELVPRDGSTSVTRTTVDLSLLDLPRGLRLTEPRSAPPGPHPGGAWVVGDVFSGLVQRRLLTSPAPDRLVVVDDGLATLHLLELLVSPRPVPIVRARARLGLSRVALGRLVAMRLRAAALAGRLVVFTCLAVGADLARDAVGRGVRLVRHDFGWLRSQPEPATPHERTVVLGTSLVANGLVHPPPYLAWVREIALNERVAYYPHHREDVQTLGPLGAEPRVVLHPVGGPAEIRLRGLRSPQRVVSLPSTAVTSLRALLSGADVSVDGFVVPETWWTAKASPKLRAHLNRSASQASLRAADGDR